MGGFFQKAFLYVLALSLGTLSVGFGLAYFSASFSTIVSDLDMNTSIKQSIFNALAPIGGIFGGPIVNVGIQRYGRKYPTIITSFVIIIGWILIIVTKKPYKELAYVGRIILGVGIGAASTVNPVFIAELSPTEVRGSYGVMSQLFCSIGTLVIYLFGIWFEWRIIAGVAMSFQVITVICLIFIPESPAYEKMKEANSDRKQVNIFQKKYSKALFISFLIVVFQQFSGINALMTNLTYIFERSKVSLNSSVSSVIVSAAKVIMTTFSTPLVEFLGRRKTWMISSIGQAIFLLIGWANEKWEFSTTLPVILLFFDVLFFGLGLGPLPWFIVPELFPDDVRGLGMGIIQAINWTLCALMVFIFPTLQQSLTFAWTYFFYGTIMMISFLYGLFLLPETKGEEMGANIDKEILNRNDVIAPVSNFNHESAKNDSTIF